MKKALLILFVLPVIYLTNPISARAQNGITTVMNIVETLQFLKDIKENKTKVEGFAKEIKKKYKETDPEYSTVKDKYAIVKLSADNIINTLIIDIMDKDKRKLFVERPSLINDYYGEGVQLYNQSVNNFNEAYLKTKEGKDKGLLDILKKLVGLAFGELMNVTKKIAIEALIERLKAPYSMMSWSEL